MKKRYLAGSLLSLAFLIGACGDDDTAVTTTPTTAPTATTSGGVTTTASTATVASGDSIAVVTIGEFRYEFDVTPGAIERCDPDFFGAFWALGYSTAGEGDIDLLLPPAGDPNFEDPAYVRITDDANGLEWVADPSNSYGLDEGESQVDSFQTDGNTASGTATFIEENAVYAWQGGVGARPEPVVGTFEVTCGSAG